MSHDHDPHDYDAHDHDARRPDDAPDACGRPDGAVRVATPGDLVGAVPYLLGYVPTDRVVVLALKDGWLRVTLSVARPTRQEAAEVVGIIAEALAPNDITDLAVIGYGPDEADDALRTLAAGLPWPVREVLRVHDGRIWSLSCCDPTCCPPGQPVVTDDRVVVPLLVSAGGPAASRADLARSLDAGPPELLARVERELRAHPAFPGTRIVRPGAPPTASAYRRGAYRRLGTARTDRALDRRPVPADTAAALLRAVRDLQVRDACTVWTDDGALHLWLDLLPTAPPGWAAPVAALLGLTAYQRGDGVLAALAAARALRDDPDYTLAHLLEETLAHGIPPHGVTEQLYRALADNPLLGRPPR